MHAGIAEVAAAKARMFVNKPNGSMFYSISCFFFALAKLGYLSSVISLPNLLWSLWIYLINNHKAK